MKSAFVLLSKILLAIFVFFSITKPALSQAGNEEKPHFKFSFLEDKASAYTKEDLAGKEFLDELKVTAFSNSTWWVKLHADESLKKKSVLILEYPLLDHVNFYFKKKNKWSIIETGDNHPFASRQVENKNFVFFLDEEMESTFFLKIKTEGPVFIPLRLISVLEYMKSLNSENYLWGIYFGIVITFILYNLISFFSMKDITYLFYILHILAFTTLQAVLNGIAFEFLWSDLPYFANISPNFFHSLSLFFVLLFSIQFLKLKEYLPFASKFFKYLATIYFLFLFASFYTPLYKYLLITQTYLIIFTSFSILFVSLKSLRKSFAPTKYYIAGWIVLFLAIIANRLKTLGYLPQNFFSTYGMLFASVLEMGLFSIALGIRIIEIRRQTENAEREKQRLTSDLHDNLGGDLTDIVHSLNKFIGKKKIKSSDVNTLRIASEKALNTLKTRIRSKEDILLLEENFIDGIRLHLITRYANTGRQLKTFVEEKAENFSIVNNFTASQSNEIFLICKEVCTNDLKYGVGESIWNFNLKNNTFSIHLSTKTIYTDKAEKGQGTNNLEKRVDKIGARIEVTQTKDMYEFLFEMNTDSPNYLGF